MKRIAVLIPCFNEEQTVGKVVGDFRQALEGRGAAVDIYVYDNNSTDGTAREALASGAILRREIRQGKGNVIRTMFREIQADCYLMADGDDTYPAGSAWELAEPVLEGRADMVIGDRLSATYFTENKRPFHNLGNRLVRGLINRLFQSSVKDIMTGYRACSPLFAKSFPVLSRGFEIETEMTIHALDKNFRLLSVPVSYRDRPLGSISKLNTLADGRRVLGTVFRLFRDYRPMGFFGFFGSLCLILAAAFGLPVVGEYFSTGQVPRFPTLIVSCVTAVIGLLLWMCGLILTVIGQKHRALFELYMNLLSMELKRDGNEKWEDGQ